MCAKHFAPECFTNLQQYEMGFADFLSLIDMAVPTIYTVGPVPSVKVSNACLVNIAFYSIEEPPTSC